MLLLEATVRVEAVVKAVVVVEDKLKSTGGISAMMVEVQAEAEAVQVAKADKGDLEV